MVFNVLAVNQDDHVKNISFLMDRLGNWSLPPAYDITFAYNESNRWLKSHQMSIYGKTSNFDKDDLIQCGLTMDNKVSKCRKIIDEVYRVVMQFDTFARKVNLKETTINLIMNVLKKRHATIFGKN